MEHAVIVVDLICSGEHRFEGWFASHEEFERQCKAHLVSCPVCETHEVRRLPSALNVVRSGDSAPTEAPQSATPSPEQLLDQLVSTLRTLSENTEDVGTRFADEARKIHFGDAESRAIKGIASLDETRGLIDEGITVLPLPAAKEDLH